MIVSASRTVESRCAMTKVVRSAISASMPACTNCSVRVSMLEVASSRMSAGGSATAARAMVKSCR